MDDVEKGELIKKALLIVDELGDIDIEDIYWEYDFDLKEKLEKLVKEAKTLKRSKFWKLK